MTHRQPSSQLPAARRALPLAVAASLLLAAGALRADDRDFVRKSVENPYVFILLDVSGSMNWTTQCSAADLAAGKCRQLCTTQDCFAPLNADDPASKFYQAKEALHAVLSQVDDVNFGFATYNQDYLNVASKHWLYRATTQGVDIGGGLRYPAIGATEVFGRTWACISADSSTGCSNGANNNADPALITDPWSLMRLQRLPKLGDLNDTDVKQYIRRTANGTMYELTYTNGTASLPQPTIDVSITSRSCTNLRPSSCNTIVETRTVTFALVDEFISWDNGAGRRSTEGQGGFYDQSTGNGSPPGHNSADATASNTCGTNSGGGWDPNSTPTSPFGENNTMDPYSGYNLRWPTTNLADPRGKWFFKGDVLPLDWQVDNKGEILRRLAPVAGGFDQSPFFADHPRAGENYLRLRDEANRPLLASGSTPLGDSIKSFRTWYAGCAQGNCPRNSGWRDVAAAQDPNWGCRKKYLIVLTDGDETCGGGNSACSGTASLRAQEGISTYVVAFGVQGGGNTLTCMAANGGTGSPIYPQNKQDLVDALTQIFSNVREEARAFASAAVPSVQANVKDKIFLTDFTPINGASVWDGHLDAFLKPLPTKTDGTPDKSTRCSASRGYACHLWDVGEEIEKQAPSAADVSSGNYKMGLAPDQRRVFYPGANGALRFLQPPAADSDWIDLFQGFGFADTTASNANKSRGRTILGNMLKLKDSGITIPGTTPEYVLGDVFHSDPLMLDNPSSFGDFSNNRYSQGVPCSLSAGADTGYRCFAFKHQNRRKLLIVGANDGQLHAFDAGVYEDSTKTFGNGTGREVFSFVPRMVLPILRAQGEGTVEIFGVDGPPSAGDVYFESDSQWHTVVVGGLREGSSRLGGGRVANPESGSGSEPLRSGYYALDVTQPDPLDAVNDSNGAILRFVPRISGNALSFPPSASTSVPGCTSTNGTTPSGCPRPFPTRLWEFTDRSPLTGQLLDEDGNGDGDLGMTWSKPVLTRIKVQGFNAQGQPVTVSKFVAIVGGGLDPDAKTAVNPKYGNWIYMIDIETGQAIYKREVEGSVPAVAALDSNFDDTADFVYFGTTAGRVYKIDLTRAQLPANTSVRDRTGVSTTMPRITGADWNPLLVFRTASDIPIYMPIQLVYIARTGQYSLAFGAGDREDLWSFDSLPGRFYMLVDQAWKTTTPGLPLTELAYDSIDPDSSNLSAGVNLLIQPSSNKKPGWFMPFEGDERVITKAFAASNILIFSTFQPQIRVVSEGNGNNAETFCSRTGRSRNFVVSAVNGNAIAALSEGSTMPERYKTIEDFMTNPFVEQTQTQNTAGQGTPPAGAPTAQSCSEDDRLAAIADYLKSIGPEDAKYGNYYLRVGQRESKGGVFYPACIPIGIVQKNWKEN